MGCGVKESQQQSAPMQSLAHNPWGSKGWTVRKVRGDATEVYVSNSWRPRPEDAQALRSARTKQERDAVAKSLGPLSADAGDFSSNGGHGTLTLAHSTRHAQKKPENYSTVLYNESNAEA